MQRNKILSLVGTRNKLENEKLELTYEEGKEIWEQLKPTVIELLKDESEKLKEKLFSVKPILQPTLF